MRVRVTGKFLTVHWEEIIREWVKTWVTPARESRERRGTGGKAESGSK